jgi:hypothetical protein
MLGGEFCNERADISPSDFSRKHKLRQEGKKEILTYEQQLRLLHPRKPYLKVN